MILGLGVDACEIERMRKNIENPRFLERFFAPCEREYILARGAGAAASLAACFAAKEAMGKALGVGLRGLDLKEIAVIHRDTGAPRYELSGAAKALFERLGGDKTFLSISHDGGLALAVAVIEGKEHD